MHCLAGRGRVWCLMQSLRSLHPSNSYHERWCDEWGRTTWKVFSLKSQGCPKFWEWNNEFGVKRRRGHIARLLEHSNQNKRQGRSEKRERERDQSLFVSPWANTIFGFQGLGSQLTIPSLCFYPNPKRCSCILFKILSPAKMWVRQAWPSLEATHRRQKWIISISQTSSLTSLSGVYSFHPQTGFKSL